MAVDLRIPSGLFIGGQPIRGEAILHFPDLLEDDIEEVHVKLRAYQRMSALLVGSLATATYYFML